MTMLELIDEGFFPEDDQGRPLVPVQYDGFGPATILSTNAPGLYPIVGVGAGGYATQYDENGTIRAEVSPDVFLSSLGTEANSLQMPECNVDVSAYAVVDSEGFVVGLHETRGGAERDRAFGGTIIELSGEGYLSVCE